MYLVFILFINLLISGFYSERIEKTVLDYFNSATVRNFRKVWEPHRKPLEHAITLALKETVGTGGMNVYIKKAADEKLSPGYLHNDNQIRLILNNLILDEIPRCYMPDVQFSLSSNVLKIQTTLSKMLIHADYSVVRNYSDIIYETKDQNVFKSSPFLFQQVHDSGSITITMKECVLLGFIMATLSGESINLGYQQFKLINCQFAIEIFRPGDGSPVVAAKYLPYRENNGIDIKHLVMKPIYDDLVPKLQAALFSYVNTSSIFYQELVRYRFEQSLLFETTAQFLTDLVRRINQITIAKNRGTVRLEDYDINWEDENLQYNADTKAAALVITVKDLVLNGLDTLYSAHIGGPYKLNTPMIGEELRLSSVQVLGNLFVKAQIEEEVPFSAEISDLSVDLQLNVNNQQDPELKKIMERQGRNKEGPVLTFKSVEATTFRKLSFSVPTMVFKPVQGLIIGYLLSAVPVAVTNHFKNIIPQVLKTMPELQNDTNNAIPGEGSTENGSEETALDDDQPIEKESLEESSEKGSKEGSEEGSKECSEEGSEDQDFMPMNTRSEKENLKLEKKNPFLKRKKRFMGFSKVRSGHLQQNIKEKSKKREVDNQINKTK